MVRFFLEQCADSVMLSSTSGSCGEFRSRRGRRSAPGEFRDAALCGAVRLRGWWCWLAGGVPDVTQHVSDVSTKWPKIRFILVARCGKGRVTQQSTWTHLDLDLCKSFNVESKGRGWECDTSRQIKQLDSILVVLYFLNILNTRNGQNLPMNSWGFVIHRAAISMPSASCWTMTPRSIRRKRRDLGGWMGGKKMNHFSIFANVLRGYVYYTC